MLTYQLQDRVIRMIDQAPPEFPSQTSVKLVFGPLSAFGAANEPGRLVIRGHRANVLWDSNTGRTVVQADPPLEPLDVTVETPNQRMTLVGNTLQYEFECHDIDELNGVLQGFLYVFPALLNRSFADPPYVTEITGSIGEAQFRWQHREASAHMAPQTADEIEAHAADCFTKMELFTGIRNRRLAAGLHYFLVASRLLVVGTSQWEFMAEAVLNMTKSLQIMFGETRDEVRAQLATLGYSEDEIEGNFVPIMILRNKFDVGHPRLAIFRQDQLRILYRYLSASDSRFRELFQRLLEAVQNGTYEIGQVGDLRLDAEEQREFDRLIESMRSRLPDRDGNGAA